MAMLLQLLLYSYSGTLTYAKIVEPCPYANLYILPLDIRPFFTY